MANDPGRKKGPIQLDNFQGSPSPSSGFGNFDQQKKKKKSCKGSQRPAGMNKEHLKNLKHAKAVYINGRNRRRSMKTIKHMVGVRKAKAHMQLNLVTEVESNKDCYSSSSNKRNTFGPTMERGRRDGDKEYKNDKVSSAIFVLVLTSNSEPLGLSNP